LNYLIKTPTRTTQNTTTLIDNIITNKPEYNLSYGVAMCAISDHDLIYSIRKKPKNVKSIFKTITTRSFKNTNFTQIKEMVKSAPWWILQHCKSASAMYNIYEKTITHILNIHAPSKTFKVRAQKKPWMSLKYENLTRKANHLKAKYRKRKDPALWKEFKQYRNKATHLKLRLKSEAIKNKCAESQNKSKDMWKIINTEVGRCKQETNLPTLIHEGKQITNEDEKLNLLCNHFTQNPENIKLAVKLPVDQNSNNSKTTLNKLQVTEGEVLKAINTLDINKPSGNDNIPAKVLKSCADEIAPFLTVIINKILEEGEFPDALKIALITPLYKRKGERNNVKNYRPISVLPATAKLIEKLVYDKVMAFLEKHGKIMDQQHGYRESRSTQSAIIILTDAIKQSLDNGYITGAVFIDFVQAFDKVQHDILLRKLQKYGITGTALKWFQSYFSNRQLIVIKNGKKSKPYNLIQATPQGSSLSGLNFTMYLNDIPEILQHSKCIFYADDLVLYVQGTTPQEIEEKLQQDLLRLQEWCEDNKMEINIPKTKSMFFEKHKSESELCLTLNTSPIEKVTEFKYLGLTLNAKLTFDNHYEKVCKNMTSRTHMLNRYKKYFTFKWRHIFATSLIHSLLDYCLPVWGNLKATKLTRINRIILRSAKLVILGKNRKKLKTKLDYIEQLNWLLCEERLEKYTLDFIFKNVHLKSSLTSSLTGFTRNDRPRASKYE